MPPAARRPDVLGRDAPLRQVPGWVDRPPRLLVLALVLAAVCTVAAGAVAAGGLRPGSEAPRGEPVALVPAGDRATAVGRGAVGVLSIVVSNRLDTRVRLASVRLLVAGAVLESVAPLFGRPLEPRETRDFALTYRVADCADLVLPGRLLVAAGVEGAPLRTAVLTFDRGGGGGGGGGGRTLPLAACPQVLPAPPDLGVQAFGGVSRRTPGGAQGEVELEVRNARRPLRLLSVSAVVPGVRFRVVAPPNGLTLGADGRVSVRLSFVIADCALLRRTGRLVLQVEQDGRSRELGLPITDDPGTGTVRQASLDRVLDACG